MLSMNACEQQCNAPDSTMLSMNACAQQCNAPNSTIFSMKYIADKLTDMLSFYIPNESMWLALQMPLISQCSKKNAILWEYC